MIISVINLSGGAIHDEQLQRAIRAVNRQIADDFVPYWGFGARLRLEGKSARGRAAIEPADMRGDAILYIRNRRDPEFDGVHEATVAGIPYGSVFLEVSQALDEEWTVTLSHEALELIGDPEVNLLVRGPHPTEHRKVFHWFEMCDAVQDDAYEVDGVRVSNFVLPLYFTSSNERGGRNDFLGTLHGGRTLRSFSVNPGGYIGFFDPKVGDDVTFSLDDDDRAKARLTAKQERRVGRVQLRRLVSRD